MEKKSVFSIDKFALDTECLRQPDLVFKMGRRLAKAKKELAQAEVDFTEYKEKITANVRDKPEKYKLYKVTEGAVNNALRTTGGYKEHQTKIVELTYEVDVAMSDVYAAQSKQKSLSDLVKLHGQQYFSEPETTKEGVAAIQKDAARRKGVSRK